MVDSCSEVVKSDAEKESESLCKAMLDKLISEVKKQTVEMEDLAVCMNEIAVGLKAITQPQEAPVHALPPPGTAPTATLVTAVGHTVAATTSCAEAAHAPESPTKCSMNCSGDETASQTSAFRPDAAPSSSSTTALLGVAITSPESSVATIMVRDSTSALTSTPSGAAFHSIDLGDEHVPKLCCCQLGARKLFDEMPSRSTVVLWPPPMKWDERQLWPPPSRVVIKGSGEELRPTPWPSLSCYRAGVQYKQPWPPPGSLINQEAIIKPQYVDHNSKAVQGNVGQVLDQKDERDMKAETIGLRGKGLMRILYVAAFVVSRYASTDGRPCKPFNPLLGETYEADYPEKGVRFFSKKVSHHPMVMACHCEGKGWKFWGDSNLKSKDDVVLESAILIMGEFVLRNEVNRQIVLNADPQLEVFLRLLRSNELFLKAAVVLYLMKPKAKQMLSLDWIPVVLHILECQFLCSVKCSPKVAALYFLDQLLMGFDVDRNVENAKQMIALGGLDLLMSRLEVADARESKNCISLLTSCIQADGSCRHYIADNLKKEPIVQLLVGTQKKASAAALNLMSELVCLNRTTQIVEFLKELKNGGCLNTMHILLVHLQQAPLVQHPLAVVMLLQLDLLGDPLQYSVYREEAIDAIIAALEHSSHSRKAQEQCARALLLLAGRFSSSGEPIAEAWLLKRAGLDDSLSESFRRTEIFKDKGARVEEEKIIEERLKKLALMLLNSGNERFLTALSNCISDGVQVRLGMEVLLIPWVCNSLIQLTVMTEGVMIGEGMTNGSGCHKNNFPIHISLGVGLVLVVTITMTCSLVIGTLVTWCSILVVASLWQWNGEKRTSYRLLAKNIFGPWTYWYVSILPAGGIGWQQHCNPACSSLKAVYKHYHTAEDGAMTLQHFILLLGAFELFLSQLPDMHSLRWVNATCTASTIGLGGTAIGVTIYDGYRIDRKEVDYSLQGSPATKIFRAFNALGTIAFSFGDAMLPGYNSVLIWGCNAARISERCARTGEDEHVQGCIDGVQSHRCVLLDPGIQSKWGIVVLQVRWDPGGIEFICPFCITAA